MKKICAALTAGLLLFATATFGAQTNLYTPPDCYADVESLPIYIISVRSAVLGEDGQVIKEETGRGTVWLADKNFWVTAAHVVDYGKNVTHTLIYLDTNLALAANIVYVDEERDVAILYAESGDLEPINLMSETLLKQFEPLWNVGYPGIAGNTQVSFQGMTLRVDTGGHLVSTTLALPGMSGGPQFRCEGDELQAVGVITSFTVGNAREKHYTLEDGTRVIERTVTNAGGSWSTPHVVNYILSGMIARTEQLDKREAELAEEMKATQEALDRISN